MRRMFRPAARSLWAIMMLSLMVASGVGPAAAEGRTPVPEISRGDGERCMEPTGVMRREHMHFLQHQRDETVRFGKRAKQYSLKECISCHVKRDAGGNTIPVNASGQFCASCHAYAAVSIDCFQCHATTPDSGKKGLKTSFHRESPGPDPHAEFQMSRWRPAGVSRRPDIAGFAVAR